MKLPILVTGERASLHGQLWRRQQAKGWEYQQDPEHEEEYLARLW
jgi:hypothetical protein